MVVQVLVISALAGAVLTASGWAGAVWQEKNWAWRGHWVPGRVIDSESGRPNPYPPYTPWPAHLRVSYRVGRRQRRGILVLSRTAAADYQVGQDLDLYVSGIRGRHIRTKVESNNPGWQFLGTMVIFVGIVSVFRGITLLVRGH